MKLEYKRQAIKDLTKLSLPQKKKITKKLEILAQDPLAGKPLKGQLKNFYSLRAWPYRIIYQKLSRKIVIQAITHRQTAYN